MLDVLAALYSRFVKYEIGPDDGNMLVSLKQAIATGDAIDL